MENMFEKWIKPSMCCPIHPNLMKRTTFEGNDGYNYLSVKVYDKTCVEELSLLQKGNNKNFCNFRKKATKSFVCSGHNLSHMRNGKEGNIT